MLSHTLWRRAPRIILMSAVARPGTLERVRDAGAAGFLQKPFTQAQLVDVVRATRRD